MKFYSTILFLAACIISQAQTDLPYATSFTTESEQSDWKIYKLGENPQDIYKWGFFGERLNHNYPVGGEEITDDWIVSTGFYLGSDVQIDSLQFKGAGFGTPFGLDTVALYLLNGDRDPEVATRELVYLFTDSTYANDNVFKTIKDIEIPDYTGTSYFAFRYKTISNWLDVSIDNIAVSGNLSSVETALESKYLVYPNPATNLLYVSSGDAKQPSLCEIYNTCGVKVLSTENCATPIAINELSTGFYSVKLMVEGRSVTKRLSIL